MAAPIRDPGHQPQTLSHAPPSCCSVVTAIRAGATAEPLLGGRLLALAALDVAAVLVVNYGARGAAGFRRDRRQVAAQVGDVAILDSISVSKARW